MKGLSQLTEKIREWNFMGLGMLPTLQLAIIHKSTFNKQIIEVLKALGCHDLLYNESMNSIDEKSQDLNKKEQSGTMKYHCQIEKQDLKFGPKQDNYSQNDQRIKQKNEITLESFDPRLKNTLYGIYLTHQPIDSRIHIVIDMQNEQKINDQTLKKTKKIIEKLKRNKSIIFINFNQATHKLDSMSEHIEQFGLSYKTKQRQIRGDQLLIFGQEKRNKIKKQNISLTKKKTILQQDKKNQHSLKQQKQSKSLTEFNSLVKTMINSKFDLKGIDFTQLLMSKIEKKYISLFAVEINKNFLQMKQFHKQILTEIKRYNELFNIYETIKGFQDEQVCLENGRQKSVQKLKDYTLTKYALTSLHRSKQFLISSLLGTFTNIQILEISSKSKRLFSSSQNRSLHWQVMQIMNEIWDIQGDTLLKQIDKMPLTYIKERYKMLDYQTIGGFMPATCFQAIFSAPLRKMVQHIMETLQIIEMKIVTQVKYVIEYFFHHTSCCFDLSDSLGEQISSISKQFRKETAKVLKSQIEFISVSSEDFWSFKQVKSNLYGPQQQVYIEIKYIGKNYIKKVFDSIKETLPRLIGQNLLKQVVNFLETNSLTVLTSILNQIPLVIELNNYEIQKINKINHQQRLIDELIFYFSLKTSSEVNVKNLNERLEKGWKRMFGKQVSKKKIEEDELKQLKKQGFFAWAKQLFTRQKNIERPKRSISQQKKQSLHKEKQQVQNPQSMQGKKHLALSEKNWLLIVNTNKQVELQKIYLSGCQGFPSRLRPSIWLYLARKQYPQNMLPKVQSLLDEGSNASQQESIQIKDVYKQIDKDVNRTPPPNLFKKGYLKDSLTRILRAYSIYDKSLRYTQGMNFIVAIILCVLTHYGQDEGFQHQNSRGSKMYFEVLENNCFTIFVNMMQKKGLRKIMLIERQTITELCIKLTSYIEVNSPVMGEKIQRSGFTIEMIFSPALISALTSADVEFPLQKRVIDFLLVSDFGLLYKVIGGFVVASESLCQKLQGQMLYYFLKGKFYNEVYKVIGDDGTAKMFKGL